MTTSIFLVFGLVSSLLFPIQLIANRFSSFHCIGGSQTYSNWTHNRNFECLPKDVQDWSRICRFDDICWISHEFVFYEDTTTLSSLRIPEYLKISSFKGKTNIRNGQKRDKQTQWQPRVINSSMPQDVLYDDEKAYIFVESTFADNFGHLLHDDLFPAMTAMRLYNINASRGQLLYNGCQRLDGINPYQCEYCADPYRKETCTGCKTRTQACNDNYHNYGKLVLGHDPINLFEKWFGSNFCMKTLIVGQSQPLSLHYLDYHRSTSIRQGRDNVLQNLGLEIMSTKPVTILMVLVLITGRGINRGSEGNGWYKMDWPTLCDDVSALIGNLSAIPIVKCVDPSTQSIIAQVIDSQEASIIVAEHGTLSYAALWARDETILITIGSELHIKEPHVLTFVTYLHVFFMVYEHKNDLEGLVHHALQMLVQQRKFNLTYDAADKTYKHQQDVVNQCTSISPPPSNHILSYESYDESMIASATFNSTFGDDGIPTGHHYNITFMYTKNVNGNISIIPKEEIFMDFLYGDSVHKIMLQTFPDYQTFPYSTYIDFSYEVSEHLYGIHYTPSLPASTMLDYECSLLDMMKNLARLTQSRSYFEFSADKSIVFDKIFDRFEHAIHINLTHAYFHDVDIDGLFHVIFIGRMYDARLVMYFVKAALQMLYPNGVIIVQDCLPGHRLHATFPREPGSNVWYGNTWKVLPILRLDRTLDIRVADVDTGLGVITPRLNAEYWQAMGLSHPYDLSVTWQDLLNSAQDQFEVLTWDELLNIVTVHEIFFGPPSNVIIPKFFDTTVGNGE